MSIRWRVSKLEESMKTGFELAWPTYLSADGEEVPWSSLLDQDRVSAIQFRDLVVKRHVDEEFEEFENRARHEARVGMGITCCLPPYVNQL